MYCAIVQIGYLAFIAFLIIFTKKPEFALMFPFVFLARFSGINVKTIIKERIIEKEEKETT